MKDSYIKLSHLSPVELLARLIWGEARNQSVRGMCAVAYVVLNRCQDDCHRFGSTLYNVITRKWQFSCLNGLWSDSPEDDDPNLAKLMNDPGEPITACRVIAELALDGCLVDVTKGSTHYRTKTVDPKWDDDPVKMMYCTTIGDHVFYREL